MASGSIPCDIVRLPCGSMSTHRTRWPSSPKAAARLSVVVVFATPPFWLAKAMTLAWPVTARLLGSVGEPSAHDSRARGVLLPARHNGRVRRPKRTVSPARRDARSSRPPWATLHATGLTHVATVSFLASRAAPSLQFFFALGGGIALARSAAERGARSGYGAALASMLQTVAVMGPARVNAPLTQAITAPMIGRLQARGAPAWLEFLACLALRLVHYAVLLAAFIFVILGGIDEFTGSYETLTGWLGIVPQGPVAALAVTAVGQTLWAIFFSAIQVAAYRRALADWPLAAPPVAERPAPGTYAERGAGRFDPRAILIAALVATALLLASTSWPLLLGVAALTGGLLSGAGLELTLRRVLRAILLVAVATWMRAAAGPGGLREAFRRVLRRLRRVPCVSEAAAQMEGLDPGPRLVAAARAAADRLADVPLAPVALADAVIAWVAAE